MKAVTGRYIGARGRAAQRLDYRRSQLFASRRRGQADPSAPCGSAPAPVSSGRSICPAGRNHIYTSWRRKPAPRDPRVDPARQALALAGGNAQLPKVIIEIDHLTRFSWTLLGRPARSERELVTLYPGLIGPGADLSAAELVRMVPALAADSLGQMVLRIEADGRLRAANDAVLRFMRGHRVANPLGARPICLCRHDEP
ncbi:MAG: Tn3 family transposase, partial [Stellaceae bacterium]